MAWENSTRYRGAEGAVGVSRVSSRERVSVVDVVTSEDPPATTEGCASMADAESRMVRPMVVMRVRVVLIPATSEMGVSDRVETRLALD